MPINPQSLRRNTFSGDGSRPDPQKENDKRGEYRDTRGLDPAEGLRRALGENFRDTDDAQRAQISSYPRNCQMVYAEPMQLLLPNEPTGGIWLLRVRKVGAEETPIDTGSVSFVWDGTQSRAVISSIDGLTPDGSQYKFNFLVVG